MTDGAQAADVVNATSQRRLLTRPGGRCRVLVPGSSANLGPGFDSFGLALGVYDEVEVEATDAGVEVEVSGAGAGQVPCDEHHLVVRAVRAGLSRAGSAQPGLRLRCHNTIPHGRGVGSSAAAVVAGAIAARGLLVDPSGLDDDAVLAVANDFEGHPDNASASIFGGLVVGWVGPDRAHALQLEPHPRVQAVVCIPDAELATSKARAMLPPQVPHADAAFNAGRTALLVEAVTRRPQLLFDATEDRLHQGYRASAMPATAALLTALRAVGVAATVSGAGPSVLVLGVDDDLVARVRAVTGPDGWDVVAPGIDRTGAVVTVLEPS